MEWDDIGEKVGKLVTDAYLNPYQILSGDLTDKQIHQFVNARAKVNEFTVLSGIVYWRNYDLETMKLATLTTGVKCVPDVKVKMSGGRVIHDSHAEILSIRLFSFFLLDEIRKVKDGRASDVVEKAEKGYRVKESVKFAMYISELPCGDCSLDEMIRADPVPWSEESNDPIIRGRSSYTNTGIVRTKPGRKDSPVSFSKSCSDKLALIQLNSLIKGFIADLIAPVYLDYLVIPEEKSLNNKMALTRCFSGRISVHQQKDFYRFEVVPCSNQIISNFNAELTEKQLGLCEVDKTKNKRASELCIACSPCRKFFEVLNSGVKNGNSIKGVLKTGKGASEICRFNLVKSRLQFDTCINSFKSYSEWKSRDNNREYREKTAAGKRSIGEWGQRSYDNFYFDQL